MPNLVRQLTWLEMGNNPIPLSGSLVSPPSYTLVFAESLCLPPQCFSWGSKGNREVTAEKSYHTTLRCGSFILIVKRWCWDSKLKCAGFYQDAPTIFVSEIVTRLSMYGKMLNHFYFDGDLPRAELPQQPPDKVSCSGLAPVHPSFAQLPEGNF